MWTPAVRQVPAWLPPVGVAWTWQSVDICVKYIRLEFFENPLDIQEKLFPTTWATGLKVHVTLS